MVALEGLPRPSSQVGESVDMTTIDPAVQKPCVDSHCLKKATICNVQFASSHVGDRENVHIKGLWYGDCNIMLWGCSSVGKWKQVKVNS